MLQTVWATAGGSCGKYLAASMGDWLDAMEAEGSLVPGRDRYSHEVRDELEAMSAATIDRYLAPARAKDPIRGKSTTKPGSLLRNSITIRKAGDEVEAEPGFFEVDTVAHCGPTLVGEFARSVNFTDVFTGWVFTRAIRNNAHAHIRSAFDQFVEQLPFGVTGIDCDNGSEFINHDLIGWVNDRLNFFTPTKKPTGYATDAVGRRKRVYDTPSTPYHRLLAAGVLSPAQEAELAAYKASLRPTAIATTITNIQQQLTRHAGLKTRRLTEQALPKLPDPSGIRVHAS